MPSGPSSCASVWLQELYHEPSHYCTWFEDENKVRGKGENAPFDSDLDVLDLSPAEWKDVDAELALCKGGKRK